MREVIARFADDSDLLDFKPHYGAATVCGHAAVQGMRSASSPTTGRSTRPARTRRRTSSRPVPGRHADPLPAEHHRLHRRQGLRGGRHDQARLQDDPGGVQRQRAADHDHVRRLVRRRQLRHVRPRLRAAVPVLLAERADRGDGRRAGCAHHGDRHGGGDATQRPGREHGADRRRKRAIVANFEPSRARSSPAA